MNAVNAATVTTGTHPDAAADAEVPVDTTVAAADPADTAGPATHRPVALDESTVRLAREAAALDAAGAEHVGDFLTAETEDDVAVTVRFASTDNAYNGWAWCVTLALVDPAQPTISEVVLLPGPDALLPPRWLPWNERIRPGDLGPGDLMLPVVDDPRLVPAYAESDDPAVEDVAHELGIGRVQVMSRPGRTDTAERWHEGSFGPDSEMAKAAPANCVMCAFYLPLAGSLSAQFGACGNEMSPADGRVVDASYGCGAHSEIVIEPVPSGFRESHIDDLVLDVHPRPVPQIGATDFLAETAEDLEFEPVHPGAVAPEGAGSVESEPVASEVEPVASEVEPEPEPSAAEAQPEPIAADVEPEPIAADVEPEPIAADVEPEPIAPVADTAPTADLSAGIDADTADADPDGTTDVDA